jgi:RNA polymerase sigma factor (sigma-70 family)
VRVTANLAIDTIRRRRLRTPVALTVVDAEDVSTRFALIAAVRDLPRRQREVIVLRYLADLSVPEVAAALGVSPGSVKTHAHRGIARLRDELGASDDANVEERLGSAS